MRMCFLKQTFIKQYSLNKICNSLRELCNCHEKCKRGSLMIPKPNETNKRKKKGYCQKRGMSGGNVGQLHAVKYMRIRVVGTKQVRIFITTARGKRWKKAGRDLNVSGTGEIAASTRITTALSPLMVARGTVDRWFRGKRSKNLENVAERERNPVGLEKKGRVRWRREKCDNFTKNLFFGRILLQRGDATVKILLDHFNASLD